jgi:rfaE bifunctional protein kinase chain/domain
MNFERKYYDMELKDMNILVVGDIMLDHYVMGDVERISPEAPVPIVHVKNEEFVLGGCGNTVRNIKELGANVSCLASIGYDTYGEIISENLDIINAKQLLIYDSKETIVKERIIASERKMQMIRIDRETIKNVNHKKAIEELSKYDIKYDAIVISDYAKGMITLGLMNHLHTLGTPIIVDPKPKNYHLYSNVYMITPNEKEWEEIMKLTFPDPPNSADYILLTQGSRGMILMDHLDKSETKIDADPVEVYNVSGAGDTVVSIMAICLSMGWNPFDSAYVANKCAAYVVTQTGTSVVPKEKFIEIIKDYKSGL